MYILTIMSATVAIIGTITIFDAILERRWNHLLVGGLVVTLACIIMAVRVALFGG